MDSSFSLTNVVAAAITFFALLCSIFFLFFNKKIGSHQDTETAASSLSLLSPPSSLPLKGKHHLFVSFHGADVRVTLLSHILELFRSKGISTFIDNDMERGVSISPVLIGAIRESRVALVLLSEKYASSTWCLNELVEIIKCRDEEGQTVMTLFYKVDPTHVKKQTGDFGKVFKETCKGKAKKDIRRWEHALKEVAQIAGYHSGNWDNEAEMIKTIATDVSNKLNNSSPSSDFEGLVGMESHMTDMGPLLQLDSEEVRVIGLWGPPGIGKTTIARSLFNRHSGDFQMSLFMDNIKRKYAKAACSDDYSVMKYLQKKLMSQLTNEIGYKVRHLGTVQDRLKDKKVLVVLDDVDQLIQLEAMAKKTTWFGDGSRIIITTQDQKLLKASGIDDIYKVGLPSTDEALQMFCMYAFGQKEPEAGFRELASKVTKVVGRLPLGLRIMGSYFRGLSRSKQEWEKALRRLSISLDGDIKSILMFSFDALHDEDKNLFLHIACFFEGESVEVVEGCLADSFPDVTLGLHVLAEKALIEIISYRTPMIKMHNLLIQLGREIVRKQSDREPGKRQFLDNEANDIEEVLSDDKADTSSVIGIRLWFRKDSNSKEDIICTSERAFERFFNCLSKQKKERFPNLRFLKIYGKDTINPQSLNNISRKLRFLSWPFFRMPCLPSSFDPKFLVRLDLYGSKLEKLWDDVRPLRNLKEMDLRYCENLKELPDLSTAINLCELNLANCKSLVELPCSIRDAVNLTNLNLANCSSLLELSFFIGNAVNLQELNLSGCLNLLELPSSIRYAVNLKKLDLHGCSSLVKLPCSIRNAVNLEELYLSNCLNLLELPCSMRNLCRLSKLKLQRCSNLVVNLANINLESLEELDLSYCSVLKSYPESSTSIQDYHKLSGDAIKEAPLLGPRIWRRSRLHRLVISGMQKLGRKSRLEAPLGMSNCEIRELGPWIGRMSRLRRLVVIGMKKLVSLPQLPNSLVLLYAEDCESLERLDCSFPNPNICLDFANCMKLNQEARDLIIQTPTTEFAVLPGGEVPVCFPYRSSGSSITVKLNQMPLGTSTKFKVCIVFAYDKDVDNFNQWGGGCVYYSITSKQNALGEFNKWMGPVWEKHLYIFEVEAVEVTSTELVFEFRFRSESARREIKECGVLQLLEVPSC